MTGQMRPRTGTVRDKVVGVRLTEKEYEIIREASEKLKISKSEFLFSFVKPFLDTKKDNQ